MCRPLRILVVDDEDSVRRMTVKMLELNGHTVVGNYRYASEAIFALNRHSIKPDLIISDYQMPGGINGLEFKLVVDRNFGIPFLLVSGNPPKDFQGEILAKPFLQEELIQKINRLCGHLSNC